MEIKKVIATKLRQYLNETIDKQLYLNAYSNRINKERDGLLLKVANNPNFVFILGIDMEYQKCGDPNKCETNTYNFIKTKLEEGESHYYPVGGFLFESKQLFPIEHWWVYNQKTNQHIEVTPSMGEKPWCYAGVINFDINQEIINSNKIWDVDFFKGGNVYSWYFK
jgi:hypothetical protein